MVTEFNNIYVITINHLGNMFLVDVISEEEIGGLICWGEFLFNQNTTSNSSHIYTIVVTLCDSGISLVSLTLDEKTLNTVSIINKQTLDLRAYLHAINVRLPTDATFQRSISLYAQPKKK